jgi:hypothetical protein
MGLLDKLGLKPTTAMTGSGGEKTATAATKPDAKPTRSPRRSPTRSRSRPR